MDFKTSLPAPNREQVLSSLSLFKTTPAEQRWSIAFPFGVFGTLRAGFRNHRLMLQGQVAAHGLAFLPHFIARDIGLFFQVDGSAPFEVYVYSTDEFAKVLAPVDRLEDFDPRNSNPGRYQRTLAWLQLLPKEFKHPAYRADMLRKERDLRIDPQTWNDYPRMPCWIYSSVEQNRLSLSRQDSPILWDGVAFR